MLKINIGDKKYLMPSRQGEISWELGKKIIKIVERYEGSDNNIKRNKEILSILINAEPDVINLVQDEQISLLIDNHIFFNEKVKILHSNYIKYNRKIYKFIDLEKINVDRYSELDLLSTDKEFEKLFFSLYQRVKWYDLKQYLIRLLLLNRKNINEFNYFRVRIAHYLYYNYKKNIFELYGLGQNNEIPDDQLDGDGSIELTTLEKFGMYHIIMQYSEDDITKVLFWSDRNVKELFKYLAYMKIKNNQ